MMPFGAVLRVVKVFPHVQVTSVTRYSGWMSFFMGFLSGAGSPAAHRCDACGVNRNQGAILPPRATPEVIAVFPGAGRGKRGRNRPNGQARRPILPRFLRRW